MHLLDFKKVPKLDVSSAFVSLSKTVRDALPTFPQTFARAEGAIRFCQFVSGLEMFLPTLEPDESVRLRAAFLRASLTELCSMEETLKRDLHISGRTGNALRISDSESPMLHSIRELRNLEVHLTSSDLGSSTQEVEWRPDGEALTITMTIWTIDNLKSENFLKLKNAKYYDKKQLLKAATWLLSAQRKWGISEIVKLSINEHAENIVAHYNLGT
jgi:hypothetical protein